MVVSFSDPYPITIDYTQTLEQMIEAGQYSLTVEKITAKDFPIQGEGIVSTEILLVRFDSVIQSDKVGKEMRQVGLRSATAPEFLALGAQHPSLQQQFFIITLGPTRSRIGCLLPLVLTHLGDRRFLDLYWFEDRWTENVRFAAVRVQ